MHTVLCSLSPPIEYVQVAYVWEDYVAAGSDPG